MSYFNSQPHEEADDRSCYIVVVVFLISTHSLTKRLTCLQFPENTPWIFQLTASRRGWHRISDILNFSTVISTHSLTKRLTIMPLKPYRNLAHFNSQPHEEADDGQQTAEPDNHISTHSLTKRLTPGTAWGFVENWHFNSQPHEEADNTTTLNTHKPLYFNSQPHEEADTTLLLPYHCVFISTHSLTKRLTCFQTRDRDIQQISTHSLTKRLTDFLFDFVQNINYFNSQPHEEADQPIWENLELPGYFNSQPHEEADWQSDILFWWCNYFNSQPHEEADVQMIE